MAWLHRSYWLSITPSGDSDLGSPATGSTFLPLPCNISLLWEDAPSTVGKSKVLWSKCSLAGGGGSSVFSASCPSSWHLQHPKHDCALVAPFISDLLVSAPWYSFSLLVKIQGSLTCFQSLHKQTTLYSACQHIQQLCFCSSVLCHMMASLKALRVCGFQEVA